VTIQPNSWNPRNDDGVCTQSEYYRLESMAKVRALDAFEAKTFLALQPYIDPNRIAIMGWSHGAWTVLKALRTELTSKNSQGLFSAAGIAFYPYCICHEHLLLTGFQSLTYLNYRFTHFDNCRIT
jgi:dienelactone hydrolase